MKAIYLEPDEEITSVVEKISASSEEALAVVVPKNSTLFQSMVNLKLLLKQSRADNKKISLITTNKVGARLARELGLPVYANLGNVPKVAAAPSVTIQPKSEEHISEELPEGIKVNRYIPPQAQSPVQNFEKEERQITEAANSEEPKSQIPSIQQTQKQISEAQPTDQELPASQSPISSEQQGPLHIAPSKDPTDLPAVARRFGSFPQKKLVFKIHWQSAVVICLLLLIAFLTAVLLIPKATVKLVLPSTLISETMTLTASSSKTTEPNHLLANNISIAKQGEAIITATGKKNIGTKASGSITITNKYRDASGAGKDQMFAKGTVATDTKTKKTFVLDSSVTVGRVTFNPDTGSPIYQSKSVGVTATQAGEEYNIAPTSFSLEGALNNTVVESSSAFSGGTNKEVTVLSQEDVDKTVSELKAKLIEEAKNEVTEKSQGQKLMNEAITENVKEQKVDSQIGSQVESAKLNITLELSALVFNEEEAKKLIINKMSEKVAVNQELTIPQETQPVFTFKEFNADKTAFTFEINASGYISDKVDKKALARSISNKNISWVREHLKEKYKTNTVELEITPQWWPKRTPLLSGMISIEINFVPEGKGGES